MEFKAQNRKNPTQFLLLYLWWKFVFVNSYGFLSKWSTSNYSGRCSRIQERVLYQWCPTGISIGIFTVLVVQKLYLYLLWETKLFLFADNTNLLYGDKSLRSPKLTMNEKLRKVSKWLMVNNLSLNIEKTQLWYIQVVSKTCWLWSEHKYTKKRWFRKTFNCKKKLWENIS